MRINEKLKELRIESGLTQAELAKNLNLAQTTIASYENTNREPHLYALIAYANFFKCSIDYLADREITKNDALNFTLTAISPEEINLLKTYRTLNGRLKKLLLDYSQVIQNSELND